MLKASDNIPAKGFNIKSNVIAEITKKTANPKEILFQAYDASSNKALWVNGKQSFSVKPTETKGLPLSLIIKATGMYVSFLFDFVYLHRLSSRICLRDKLVFHSVTSLIYTDQMLDINKVVNSRPRLIGTPA